jgi:hypothetical protein
VGTLIAGWDNSGDKTGAIGIPTERQPTVYDVLGNLEPANLTEEFALWLQHLGREI